MHAKAPFRNASPRAPLPARARLALRLLAVATVLAGSSLVQAHTRIAAQDPAPDATVVAPGQACIDFSSAIEPALSHLSVHDASGQQVNDAPSSVQAGPPPRMCAALPALAAGIYEVRWTAVARDGHRLNGTYRFNVK